MATQDFSKIYYRTTNCLTSDIIADFAPVSRVLGVDTSSGMGVVFTAMGTRFDMQYVAKEAFMATENYEADTRSIDDTPVAEVMRYVRSEVIAGEQLPEKYWALTDRIKNEESAFGQYKAYSDGMKDGEILFQGEFKQRVIEPGGSRCEENGRSVPETGRFLRKESLCNQ